MGLARNLWTTWQTRRMRRAIARRLDREPVAVAQILLLFRMMLADGVVRDPEMQVFQSICSEHFGIRPAEMMALHAYLEKRQGKADSEVRDRLLKSMSMEERLRLIGLMGRIAGSCTSPHETSASDERFIRETAVALGVSRMDAS
ncbi:TerB family tellurite resistance protein [Pararhizobium haloflavum]|uniref:TerB family tellurite resistance protein n=1 Tax=Pararhizobium haloflavum TaxID=2037914 RepID=UPI000C177CF2|nr:TerB family tellurite resistance protein [Pararhizobium haloflavum]